LLEWQIVFARHTPYAGITRVRFLGFNSQLGKLEFLESGVAPPMTVKRLHPIFLGCKDMMILVAVFQGSNAWLEYEIYGSEHARGDVVLVHGLSGSKRWWLRNIPALQEEYRVFVLELPGFGAARSQKILDLPALGTLLLEFVKALKLECPVLIGHSMGAHASLHTAALEPNCFSGLVLAAASAFMNRPVLNSAAWLIPATFMGAYEFIPTVVSDGLLAGFPNLWFAAQALTRDNPTSLLSRITMPVLLLHGSRDLLVTFKIANELQQGLVNSKLEVIAGAGHNLMFDRAGEFNRLTLEFLEQLAIGKI
jgi:pimeloyl-ACP methyl ester carboxylesterase